MESSVAKIDVAGLKISPVTKKQLLDHITERVKKREKTFVVTPYSEFLYGSLRRPDVRALLNSADFAIADGVGVLWANLFLSVPLSAPGFYLKILQAWWQVVWTGASILLRPKLIYSKGIPEKIVGADLIWDFAELAEKNSFKVFLLGGWGSTTEQVAQKLLQKFSKLQIVGKSNKKPDDASIIHDINSTSPDMIFVALGAISQEQWIADNLSKTTAAFAIGLGGTFDYIAGAKSQPPKFIRSIGLEWLYRLITQPHRIGRIYRGVWGLILSLVRYKVYATTPLRLNACAVVINKDGKILVCKRAVAPMDRQHLVDYWQFPQGGLDQNENHIDGAQRELMEETGIRSVRILGEANFRNEYEWNNANRSLFSHYTHRGQTQATVFFEFLGDNTEIHLDERELVEYQWLTPEVAIKVVAPERRPHAEAVLAELSKIQV